MNNSIKRLAQKAVLIFATVSVGSNAWMPFALAYEPEPDVSKIRKAEILFCSNRKVKKNGDFSGSPCDMGDEFSGVATFEKKHAYKSRRQVQKTYAMKPLPHERLLWKLFTAPLKALGFFKDEEDLVQQGIAMKKATGQKDIVLHDPGSFRSWKDALAYFSSLVFSGDPRLTLGIDWASRGNIIGPRTYTVDRKNMVESIYFVQHCMELATRIAEGREHVQLWAHSMGADSMAQAMLRIYLSEGGDKGVQLKQFGRLDWFCSDIDLQTFVNNYVEAVNALVPAYKRVAYITKRDIPLIGSSAWQGGPRLGNSYPGVDGWIVVVYTKADAGSVGHSNPAWLRDDMATKGDEIAQLAAAQAKEISLRGPWKLVLDEKHTKPGCPVYNLTKEKK